MKDPMLDHPLAQTEPRWGLIVGLVWVVALALILSAGRGEPIGDGCEPRVEACEEGEQ